MVRALFDRCRYRIGSSQALFDDPSAGTLALASTSSRQTISRRKPHRALATGEPPGTYGLVRAGQAAGAGPSCGNAATRTESIP